MMFSILAALQQKPCPYCFNEWYSFAGETACLAVFSFLFYYFFLISFFSIFT